jgi:lipoate-protein ligase A
MGKSPGSNQLTQPPTGSGLIAYLGGWTKMDLNKWQRLHPAFALASAGRELALSETLLTDLEIPTLWWYSAKSTALILGTSQKPEAANLEYCRETGIAVYRRTSGGTAVLAEPDFVSLDVALPSGHSLALSDIVATYRWLGLTWLEALKRLGLEELRLVQPEEVRAERIAAASPEEIERDKLARMVCFGSLSPYEVVQGNRKLVGLAQIRRRAGTLLQCGIPLRAQTARFAPLLALPPERHPELTTILEGQSTSLDRLLGRVLSAEEIVALFEEALRDLWNVRLEANPWSTRKIEQAEQLEREKFTNLAP